MAVEQIEQDAGSRFQSGAHHGGPQPLGKFDFVIHCRKLNFGT
jgi:hypothetical protein